MNLINALLYALAGGLIPSLIWLWFWLHEDRLHPEPKRIIVLSFISGMIAVVVVLPFEQIVNAHFEQTSLLAFILFAIIEELCKYWGASWSAMKTRHDDEPIDPVIYMISAALGFAALENAFFLLQPLLNNEISRGIITSNLRFMGANLLHVIASATIGIFIAFSFYKSRVAKIIYLIIGIILAVILHTLFNFSIINDAGQSIVIIFGSVWLCIIALILAFEKVKTIQKTDLNN